MILTVGDWANRSGRFEKAKNNEIGTARYSYAALADTNLKLIV